MHQNFVYVQIQRTERHYEQSTQNTSVAIDSVGSARPD
jgi:hypothetical protein